MSIGKFRSADNGIPALIFASDGQNLALSEEFPTLSLHESSCNGIQILGLLIAQEIFGVDLIESKSTLLSWSTMTIDLRPAANNLGLRSRLMRSGL